MIMEPKTNIEKFKELVTHETSKWQEYSQWREENASWLNHSIKIAIKILKIIKEKNISQKQLAELLKVSPQQVSKLVKGRENFTLETIAKIEGVLNVSLIEINLESEIAKNIQKKVKKQNTSSTIAQSTL